MSEKPTIKVKDYSDEDNNTLKEVVIADYQPEEDVRGALVDVQDAMDIGQRIKDEVREEFNNRDFDTTIDDGRRAFNSYVGTGSEDPDEGWKANTVRPVTRNKVISIAAHVTGTPLYPAMEARNENEEEDRDASLIMSELSEWALDEAKYEQKMLYAVIGALIAPVVYMYVGFADVKRTIKEATGTGYKEKKVTDEEYSGFILDVVSPEEILFGNFYESDIQKQPFLIWRKIISYEDAKIKYGNNENFQYVRPGVGYRWSRENDMFYEEYDESMGDRMVEEWTYYSRIKDLELRGVGNVLMDAPDRPMQRTDKKYPFVKMGYELIDEGRVYAFRSLVDKLGSDQEVIDTLYNMIIDAAYLQLMPPGVVFGDEEIDSAVIAPGAVTTFAQESKFEALKVGSNVSGGLQVLSRVEESLSESSQGPAQSGMSSPGSQTAYETARLEQNARKVLGLFGKMIKFFVADLGELWKNTLIQHLTVAQSTEILGGKSQLRFRKILLGDKMVNGEKVSKRIDFETDGPAEMTADEVIDKKFKLMEEEEQMGGRIVKVNPKLFRELKYKVKVNVDVLADTSDAVKKALKLEAYDRMINNQGLDQNEVTKEFLLQPYVPGDEARFMKKEQAAPPEGGGPADGGVPKPAGGQPNQEIIKQIKGAGLGPLVGEG